MATYAIGDVQGCWRALQRLLERLPYRPEEDRLWLAGDLVNRGTGSLEVLRWAAGAGGRVEAVLGNHDLHLLAAAEGLRRPSPRDTLGGILAAPDRDRLLDWLRSRPFVIREGDVLLVHAGLLPDWTAEDAAAIAAELSEALVGGALAQVWPLTRRATRWRRRDPRPIRLAAALNALTVLRCCTVEGDMLLGYSGPPADAPAGALPWHEVPGRRSSDLTVVCGHWAAQGLRVHDRLVALDTGCVWGGALTAVRLEDRQVYAVPCPPGDRALEPGGGP